ncbi:MAG: hypothetical protein HY268_10875 [Deltaproteobacteria bacterium]|nr:hypothetical protein [Deltaproteobacteria bacterium]
MNLRDTVILSRSAAEAKNLRPRQTCGEILRRGVYPVPFDYAQDRLSGIQDVVPGFHPGYDFGNAGAAIAQAFPEQPLIKGSLLGS